MYVDGEKYMPLHRAYSRKPHCPRLIIIMFLVREFMCVSSPPDPVTTFENLILKILDGELIQYKGRVETAHAGAHDTDLNAAFWTVLDESIFDIAEGRKAWVLGEPVTDQETSPEARKGGIRFHFCF